MVKTTRRSFLNGRGWLVGLSTCLACSGYAQEILRSSQGQIEPLFTPRVHPQAEPGNVMFGPVALRFQASLAGSYHDNIRYADANAQDDFIVRPSAHTRAFWPITDQNSLSLSFGVAYSKYVQHSELDRLYIQPGSEVALNFYVGEVRFHIYDNLFYSLDPLDVGAVSGLAKYGGLRNAVGLTASHDFNLMLLTAGYEHFDFISTTSASDPEERSVDSVFLRAPFQVGEGLAVGPEAAASWTRYASARVHNDSQSFSVGAFAHWQVSDFLTVMPRAGVVHYDFDRQPGTLFRTPDTTRAYVDLTVHHQVNEDISHQLSGGRRQESGVRSDLLDFYYARYSIRARAMRLTTLELQLGYEHGDDSQSAMGEVFDRFWVAPQATVELAERLSVGAAYRYTIRDSEVALRDYTANVVTLQATYRF